MCHQFAGGATSKLVSGNEGYRLGGLSAKSDSLNMRGALGLASSTGFGGCGFSLGGAFESISGARAERADSDTGKCHTSGLFAIYLSIIARICSRFFPSMPSANFWTASPLKTEPQAKPSTKPLHHNVRSQSDHERYFMVVVYPVFRSAEFIGAVATKTTEHIDSIRFMC